MRRLTGPTPMIEHNDYTERYGLDELLDPANAFAHPLEVVNDLDLTLSEKRAILASWASDACAVEAAAELRGQSRKAPVPFDDIMDALRELDRQVGQPRRPHYKRVLAERRPGVFGRKSQRPADGRSSSLN